MMLYGLFSVGSFPAAETAGTSIEIGQSESSGLQLVAKRFQRRRVDRTAV